MVSLSIIFLITLSMFAMLSPKVTATPGLRAWKDETSFGLENEHLLLHGGYNTYGGKTWFDYLIFKDTGTKWTSPWDDIFNLYSPSIYSANKATVQVAAFNGSTEAKLTYSADIPASPWPHPPVHVELEIVIREDSYIYWTVQIRNIGTTEDVIPIGLTLYTFIAGDTANDYYYVPGHGQGQFIGTQQNINYDPSESWVAVWDEAKQEGCGIVTTQGFSDLNVQISDWYDLTAVPEMVHFGENITLHPEETSRTYNCYYYFFTGTGWQKTKAFYDAVYPISAIGLTPNSGFASATVVGSGFSPNSKITVAWDDTEIPTVPSPLITDSYGNFTAIISVPTQTEPGTHTVKATDESGNWANATFTVIDMTVPRGQKGETRELSLLVDAFTIAVSIIALCLATIALLKKKT